MKAELSDHSGGRARPLPCSVLPFQPSLWNPYNCREWSLKLTDHTSAARFTDGKTKAQKGGVDCDLLRVTEGAVLGLQLGF